MVVLDASGILNAFGFRFDRTFYTTHSVIDEIKDLRSKTLVESGIISGKLKVLQPSKKNIGIVIKEAKKIKLDKVLSKTDIEVLALGLELEDEVWTDDNAMARVGKKLGIKTKGVIFR